MQKSIAQYSTATAASGSASTAASMASDTPVPAAPVIASETVGAGNVVTISGTSEANDTIDVYDGTALLGDTIAEASGAWSFVAGSLPAGEHDITATATDRAGATSAHSPDPVVAIPAAPVILSASPDSGPWSALTTTSNQLTVVGAAAAGTTITVFDGSTDLGTATTNASGVWTFTTGSPLTDGAHSFIATAANASGAQSSASSALAVTVASGTGSFSALTDQWHNPITIGGSPYYVENANVNGNAPWAISEPNDHTVQFNLRPGDLWPDNGSNRTEVGGATLYAPTSTVNISYQLTVQPGLADYGLAWEIIGQLHSDDGSSITQSISGDPPVFSFHLTGADGKGGGDYLAILGMYALSGQTTPTAATPAGNPYNGYLYVSPQPIVRGQSYSIQVEGSFQNNSNGFVEVWINGQQVVDYHGPIGYGASNYWKEGVYEGWSTTQPITIDYANTVVAATPAAPVITGDTVNGNLAMLSGTAEANSTVSVYDGSTLLGSTVATGGGNWNYTTGALSIGAHSITAKAKDSAGNVSGASLAIPTAIAAFTGPIVTAVTSSSVSGEATVGTAITFTLAMSSAVTVSGAPQLTLSDGGAAAYAGGSGTNALTFRYTVSASDNSTSALAVTGVRLPTGAAITDGSGNAAILVGASKSFNNIVVDTTPVSAPVFGSFTANANGSISMHGTAAPNTTVHEIQIVWAGGVQVNLDGAAAVDATGNWTYTTPSLINGTWNGLTAYDENSLGDVSATTTNNGAGVTTSMLPSPVIQTTDVNGNAVTLSGVIPSSYGNAGPAGATVLVFDGATKLGSTTTTAGGQWSFTTSSLANGAHSFTVESQNSYGASAPSIPIPFTLGSLSVVDPSVTVAYYLAHRASLDAAGNIAITDTAASVAANIDALNADAKVASITLTGAGTPTLTLTVAQALNDTHALGAITNASYAIAVIDTAADVSANFDALNADTRVTSIAPRGSGTQTLMLTVTQALNDRRALSILDPFAIAIVGTAARLQALTAAQIANLSGAGLTRLQATDQDVTFTVAQKQALGAARISLEQPYSGGSAEVINYSASGTLSSVQYLGIVGAAYTSCTVTYGANGKPASATYSNGMKATWRYNTNGSYQIAYAGVTGAAFTSYTVRHATNGEAENASYSNGMTAAWTYNPDGSYRVAYAGVTGAAYTSYTVRHASNGEAESASYSNGMTAAWTYNADGSYRVAYARVTGAAYTSYTVLYASNGETKSASYSNGMTAAWSYNADGSYDIAFAHVTGQPYSSYTAVYNSTHTNVATAENMTNGSGGLFLHADGLTISSSSGALSVKGGADAFAVNTHATEAISATGLNLETFNYASGFGRSTIAGLHVGGSTSDVIQLHLSMFSGLSSSNTVAQNLAKLLSTGAAAQSGTNVTIADSAHDVLTLAGVTTTTLSQNAASVFKFV